MDYSSNVTERAVRVLTVLSWTVFVALIIRAALTAGDLSLPIVNVPLALLGVCAIFVTVRVTPKWETIVLIIALLYIISTVGRFLYWSVEFAQLDGSSVVDGIKSYAGVLESSWAGRAEKYGAVSTVLTVYGDVGHFLAQAVLAFVVAMRFRSHASIGL